VSAAERFAEVYTRRLAAEVAAHPEEYGYTVAEVPAVVGKMVAALAKGSANKEGRAIRGTCRELGIPYTYAGLRTYFAAGVRP
jgi:hypothetical protein